jgi:ATP-dependent Clp protease adaptor protein ClpS
MKPIFSIETEEEVLVDEEMEVKEELNLVLYNDDVNTFQWVIECLCEICKHSPIQAEQCALLVHYNGKCSVKRGTYDKLRPMCEALLDRKLSAVIE